ncbi:MAG TPA: hydantoinase/oxoprolinase family protein [Pseudonocardiaceae bacterium]|jgi:N-methylhydantoinase A/oxoprolinase/acetone carboxylase beta subunit
MGVRVGADVGGTFTKAVAIDSVTGELAGRAVVPTTHEHRDGVSAGVVDVVAKLVAEVGAEAIELVTHSTTQAVNALLEGDTVPVGVLGMARPPYLRKARNRTTISRAVAHEFLDLSGGFDAGVARQALARLASAGAQAVCVAEAFAPDDSACEDAVAVLAAELGLPVTTSSGLTGLYGLELRTVTAALNASILPIALRTAEVVEAGVAAAGLTCPVMVMRGDGGATDLAGFRAAPARTLYSGPAASVAGALRTLRIGDGVIVEVGGTSTNVAAITAGRPALSYVRVAGQATAVRALDVQVAGVAGGSMLRVRRRRIYGVGPRSAHIAGLTYSCFLAPERLAGARPETLAPRPGDPADYLALRLADGTMAALTNTCAANALGLVTDGDYAAGNRRSATVALDIAGAAIRLSGNELARRMMQASTEALADLVTAVAGQHRLTQPTLIAVGGGASVLGRALAGTLGLDCQIPPGAEVISSMGDALSLVRAERERTVSRPTPADVDALIAEVEAEALAAGASPTSLQVQVSQIGDRGAIRAVAVGALVLGSGVVPGRPPLSREAIIDVARAAGGSEQVDPVGRFWLSSHDGRVLLFDRFGDPTLDVRGEAILLDGSPDEPLEATIRSLVSRHVRNVGPITVQPTTWVVQDGRIRELADPDAIAETVGGSAAAAVIVGRA